MSSPPVTDAAGVVAMEVLITPFGPAERTQTGVGGGVADVKFAALMTYGLPHGSTGSVTA
jgi:hypothetical protein